jgi:glycogen operon protein
MLLGGDEIGRTQQGNNNAYCQDTEISWFDWSAADRSLLDYTCELIKLRREHPVFRRRRWFRGESQEGALPDIAWFKADGAEMSEQDWNEWFAKSFMMFLNGDALRFRGRTRRLRDDSFLLLFNAHSDRVAFTLPPDRWGARWISVLDTARGADAFTGSSEVAAGAPTDRLALSMQVLRRA